MIILQLFFLFLFSMIFFPWSTIGCQAWDIEMCSTSLALCVGIPQVDFPHKGQRCEAMMLWIMFSLLLDSIAVEQRLELLVICDAPMLMYLNCNVLQETALSWDSTVFSYLLKHIICFSTSWLMVCIYRQSYTVKPAYNDHLMGYSSAFWSSSRWPRAT